MIIEFNNSYNLETILTKVDAMPDLYELKLVKTDLLENVTSTDLHYFNIDELKKFVTYLNKATNGYI